MAEVVLYHHVQGLTDGVRAFADRLWAGGHVVHTPDLFAGALAGSIEEGFALSQEIGREVIAARATADLPGAAVFAGISFGVMTAQRLAQTRPGVRGALFYEACLPITGEWAIGPWPASRSRSTAWTRTRSSPSRATSTPRVSSSKPSDKIEDSFSCTPGTATCSPTIPCRRTTRPPPTW